ncbi:OB-fold nucleic acid binding domain-containing protein [Methanopyrus sp. SNP6]|uniref:OB-fold nucleic acid binding domain-containing protein n=1 Tax=Methanopyrus sp. SNP6 TaxID=1937005 RepID=UPI0011E5C04B|nr:OB-fold nucleic acid binding domain-containing protein [Methanopyrus sp. SNP6]
MEKTISIVCITLGAVLLWMSSGTSHQVIGARELQSTDDGTLVRIKGEVMQVKAVSGGAEVVILDAGDGTVTVFLSREAASTLAPSPGESLEVVGRVEEYRGRKEVRVDSSVRAR